MISRSATRCGGTRATEPDARFGWETTSPLLARVAKAAGQSPPRLPPAAGYFEVSPANVVLVNAKRAEDGCGFVVRLFETAGRKVEARVKCGFTPAGKAAVVRLTEDLPDGGAEDRRIEKDTILSEIGPYEIQTIRVSP